MKNRLTIVKAEQAPETAAIAIARYLDENTI
jgi:hypothetical protein